MMTRFRRVAVFTVAGALTAGALTAGVLTMTAQAGNTVPVNGISCQSATAAVRASCYLAQEIRMPLSVTVPVTTQPAQNATVSWTSSCSAGGNVKSATGTATAMAPFAAKVGLPRTNGADCTITATATVNGLGTVKAGIAYTQGQAVMINIPQGVDGAGQPRYALRCLTDLGNRAALRDKVLLEGCATLDSQTWAFHNGELIRGRMCLTDKGNGGIRSKVILYTCKGTADQIWTYRQSGGTAESAFVLKSHGGRLCLDDPKTSTAFGTQLIVYTCNGAMSQRWIMG